VLDTDDFAAALDTGPNSVLTEGADVIGSDQMKVGTVDEVVLEADGRADRRRGLTGPDAVRRPLLRWSKPVGRSRPRC
jgi:hypothetical protein